VRGEQCGVMAYCSRPMRMWKYVQDCWSCSCINV